MCMSLGCYGVELGGVSLRVEERPMSCRSGFTNLGQGSHEHAVPHD